MTLKKLFVILLLVRCSFDTTAQTNSTYAVQMPEILPASPEASTFVKAGVGNVNLSTGALTATIPLYTIKVRDYILPISLSYSTQGTKADEASSRVGFGWVLNATGMITRIVKGKPDESVSRLVPPADFAATTLPVYNYCTEAADATTSTARDSQADEFQFNFNGYSGKFVLDNNLIPRVTANSNLLVRVQMVLNSEIDKIFITTPDGVKYQFGAAYEKTITHNVQQFKVYKDRIKTAFFLDNIELPTGEKINFEYASINTRSVTGIKQELRIGKNASTSTTCSDCNTNTLYIDQQNTVEYQTNYLSGITTTTGLSIDFTYEDRPDLSYDNRLKGVDVTGLKKYVLEYYDVSGSASKIMGRFLLTKVRDVILGDIIDLSNGNDYVLAYNSRDQLPLPITFKQDYLGFLNNSSVSYLIPPTLNSSNTISFSHRNPSGQAAMIGTLASIQYPTGGTETFSYESNTVATSVKRNTFVVADVTGNGGTEGYKTYTCAEPIVIKRNQVVTMSGNVQDAILNDGVTADPNHPTMSVDLYEGSTLIASRSVLGLSSTSTTINLYAGHVYTLKITVRNYTERGYGSIRYDYSDKDIYDIVNVGVPGLRIREIKRTDPFSTTSTSKFYTYSSLGSLGASTGASPGVNFKSSLNTRLYCEELSSFSRDCIIDIYSSNSTSDVYGYSGSGSVMYYKTVIESDDPSFKNGGTEITFHPNNNGGNNLALLGNTIPEIQTGQFPTLTGTVFKRRIFDNTLTVVQEEQDDYETLIDLSNAVASYYVRSKYSNTYNSPDWPDAFDVNKMLYGNYWNRLKSKTIKTYSVGGSVTQKTDYSYGAFTNIEPTTIITTDSKGSETKAEFKYPTDFPTDAVLAKFVTRNILNPKIIESSFSNNILLQQKKTIYSDWFNDSKILLPATIQMKETPTASIRDVLIFDNYDAKGNLLQAHKASDISTAYIWDAAHALPLCEVRNADYAEIAFTSFEAGVKGNWTFPGAPVADGMAPAGNQVYKLSSGPITKALVAGSTYYITYWSKSGTIASVTTNTGATVSARNVIERNGWTLYEHTLSSSTTSVAISGTATIDELRLYPSGSLMTTRTYIPFVGVTSESDANNRITYYEYDGMGRLNLIRDANNNILEKFCYNYQGQVENCN